ncbi:MAG: anti-sigma factor family protein [Actinomycetota bacterium]
MPDHPDREQLAAFQAGDGDRRQRAEVEAHLAGCPSCAEVAASVEQARRRLAVLEEPALPPGLHDRLAAAVEAEAAPPAPANRPAPWYRRPVAWAAAAALLLAALIVPFLDRSSGNLTTAGGSSRSSQEAATAGGAADADRIPVIGIPGEVSAATVRSRLATDSRARNALDSAGAPGAQAATPRASQGAGPGTQSPDQAGGGHRSSAQAPPAGATSLKPCLPAATAAADRPLRPAFFIQGAYRGREATILVTTSTGEPGRVDLWVFPRDNCSSRPLATEQVR